MKRELTDTQPDAAAPLFHVSAQALAVGQRLRSYTISTDYAALIRLAGEALNGGPEAIRRLLTSDAFARLHGQGGYQVEMVHLEAVFERVRARNAPQLPSRLEAVYVWRTLALARQFRAAYRPDGIIHRCALVTGTAIERDGALVAAGIDLTRPLVEELAQVERRAARYWRAREPMLLPEMLVRGTVVVEAVVAAGGHEG